MYLYRACIVPSRLLSCYVVSRSCSTAWGKQKKGYEEMTGNIVYLLVPLAGRKGVCGIGQNSLLSGS